MIYTASMQFEWDPRKASTNIRKHRIRFEEAIGVFTDPLARIFTDPDHSEGEFRELILGRDRNDRFLIVSFVESHGKVRIISARRATSNEVRAYEENTR